MTQSHEESRAMCEILLKYCPINMKYYNRRTIPKLQRLFNEWPRRLNLHIQRTMVHIMLNSMFRGIVFYITKCQSKEARPCLLPLPRPLN